MVAEAAAELRAEMAGLEARLGLQPRIAHAAPAAAPPPLPAAAQFERELRAGLGLPGSPGGGAPAMHGFHSSMVVVAPPDADPDVGAGSPAGLGFGSVGRCAPL